MKQWIGFDLYGIVHVNVRFFELQKSIGHTDRGNKLVRRPIKIRAVFFRTFSKETLKYQKCTMYKSKTINTKQDKISRTGLKRHD